MPWAGPRASSCPELTPGWLEPGSLGVSHPPSPPGCADVLWQPRFGRGEVGDGFSRRQVAPVPSGWGGLLLEARMRGLKAQARELRATAFFLRSLSVLWKLGASAPTLRNHHQGERETGRSPPCPNLLLGCASPSNAPLACFPLGSATPWPRQVERGLQEDAHRPYPTLGKGTGPGWPSAPPGWLPWAWQQPGPRHFLNERYLATKQDTSSPSAWRLQRALPAGRQGTPPFPPLPVTPPGSSEQGPGQAERLDCLGQGPAPLNIPVSWGCGCSKFWINTHVPCPGFRGLPSNFPAQSMLAPAGVLVPASETRLRGVPGPTVGDRGRLRLTHLGLLASPGPSRPQIRPRDTGRYSQEKWPE